MKVGIVMLSSGNLSSVRAWLERAGCGSYVVESPRELEEAERIIVPGVGAFGPAMERLRASGMDRALKARAARGLPTAGFCLGMQVFFDSSAESPGAQGLGILPGSFRPQPSGLRSPRLGWGLVRPEGRGLVEEGWAAFANSFRLSEPPGGSRVSWAAYGEPFVAALEAGGLLLCQFHPELSGAWGARLLERWLKQDAALKSDDTGKPSAGSDSRRPAPAWSSALTGGRALRVIPCLDVKDGRVVKGTRFADLRDAGDPAELALRYEMEGADELVLLDISAGAEGRSASLEAVRKVRSRIGIPLCVGGGVGSVEDASRLIEAGADKVSVNTRACRRPELIGELAEAFGRQAVVAAVDAASRPPAAPMTDSPNAAADRGRGAGTAGPGWEVLVDAGKTRTGIEAVAWARRAEALGAGEILLTSVDRDGTGLGYDLALVQAVSKAVRVPVVASGGASTPGQMLEGAEAGASALLAAGAFHRGDYSVRDVKEYLAKNGKEIRLC